MGNGNGNGDGCSEGGAERFCTLACWRGADAREGRRVPTGEHAHLSFLDYLSIAPSVYLSFASVYPPVHLLHLSF